MSSEEKILSEVEELSAYEEPFLLDNEHNQETIVNTNNSIDGDIKKLLTSYREKEETLKKNDITHKELIKNYEEEIKELKNSNHKYDKKIKNEVIQEVGNFFRKQKQRNTLKIIVDQQLKLKKLDKSINNLKKNNKLLEASNISLKSNLVKIAELEKDLKNNKIELSKQKQLEGKIDIFEKRIEDTEKEIETQSLVENKIVQLENSFFISKQETNKKEDININNERKVKAIKIDENIKNELYGVEQERLRTDNIIREQEKQLKTLYQEKSELNQNMLDFQKNRSHLQIEFICKQKELIKKYEEDIKEFQNLNKINNDKIINLEESNHDLINNVDKIKELKNLNREFSEKILDLKETNKNLKNQNDEIKHYQNDNLRLSKELFENSKKLENTKAQLKEVENNKSRVQQQINDLNNSISEYNIVESEIDQVSQNNDTPNISRIAIKEKPKIELDSNKKYLEEKNEKLDDMDEKIKNIFAN